MNEELFVYVCDLCGQPLAPGSSCASGLHTGPGSLEFRGAAVRTDVLVAELNAARAELREVLSDMAVVFEDSRLGYVEVQVSHETLAKARALEEEQSDV